MVTPAVLRNNRTMETLPNEEPPRKRQCRSRVRFSEEKNQTRVFDNFAEMTETDRTAVRQQLWYTVRAHTPRYLVFFLFRLVDSN